MAEITQILSAFERGDPEAAEQLLPLVYDELRKLAASKLRNEQPGQTLDATALVHEAYVRLVNPRQQDVGWQGRGHFFAAAAEAMRRILVENARRKSRVKHGGDRNRVELHDEICADEARSNRLLALDEALTRLEQEDAMTAQLVKLRYFTGLSLEQAAEALNISRATGYRSWSYAKAWLQCALEETDSVL